MDDFRREVLKVDKPRVHKIKNSLGVYDSYKWLRKRHWIDVGQKLTEHEFYSIIRNVNKELAANLSNGIDIKLPYEMGTLELRKINTYVNFNEGKLHSNLPIDWNKTLQLWCEDKESSNNKTLIRAEEKNLFKIYYNKFKAKYTNKVFYQFNANRELKIKLKENVKKGKVDAFLLNKE